MIHREWIEERSIPEPNSGCWLWLAGCTGAGYGAIQINKRYWLAHRLSYVLHNNGALADDELVRHTCDNPGCVNPDHLIKGTPKDNTQDAVKRHRMAHGQRIWTNKLSPLDVTQIRLLLKRGVSCAEIARRYDMDRTSISCIKLGKTWRHP